LLTYQDLYSKLPTLAGWLAEEPALTLHILNEFTFGVVSGRCLDYFRTSNEVFISVTDLPV
jgi:hypothetical protein